MAEKIDKIKYYVKYNMPKSIFAYIILAAIIGGYLIFIISAKLFPEVNSGNLLYTELDERIDIGFSKSVSINSWDYCENKGQMSVILNYSGTSNSGKLNYEYIAAVRSKNGSTDNLHVEEKYKSETYQLIVINGIKDDFKEVLLKIEVTPKDSHNEEDTESTNLYTNFENVSVVNELTAGSLKDVMLRILDRDIDKYLTQIESLNDDLEDNKKKISEIDSSINGLNKDILYATADKVNDIRDQIGDLQSNKEDILNSNINIESEIKSIEAKISDINTKIGEIKNNDITISETESESV